MAESAGPIGRRPWWQQDRMRFAKQGQGLLRRQFPAIGHLHEDLIAETLLGVAHHLGQAPPQAPAAWFQLSEPSDEEQARFYGLCRTILSRRINDHFRGSAGRWFEEASEGPESQEEPASEAPAPDRHIDLRRTVARLLAAVERLPEADRLLLERVALGDVLGPMSTLERQRLHRLRTLLAGQLHKTLGAHPLDLTRPD